MCKHPYIKNMNNERNITLSETQEISVAAVTMGMSYDEMIDAMMAHAEDSAKLMDQRLTKNASRDLLYRRSCSPTRLEETQEISLEEIKKSLQVQ